jgi:Domain of unknown function (DUF6484)
MIVAMPAKPKPTTAVPDPATSPAATKLGVLLTASAPGALIVEYEGSGPLRARSTIALDQPSITRAITIRQPVLLLFENGDARLPIVVGLIQPEPGAALLHALLAPVAAPQLQAAKLPAEARVDGKRVVLEGEEEVTLKCGAASITLRRDGKVILRGAYVETTAKGVNRIRGGSVKIN